MKAKQDEDYNDTGYYLMPDPPRDPEDQEEAPVGGENPPDEDEQGGPQ